MEGQEIIDIPNIDKEIVTYLADGWSTKEIGILMKMSSGTIETYRTRLIKKYKCKNSIDLVSKFIRSKIIE